MPKQSETTIPLDLGNSQTCVSTLLAMCQERQSPPTSWRDLALSISTTLRGRTTSSTSCVLGQAQSRRRLLGNTPPLLPLPSPPSSSLPSQDYASRLQVQ